MRKNNLIRDVHSRECTTQTSTGAAPRPFERRPVPEGRKIGWWRQPERLFERAQRASCAEGSDQAIFQAAVMGRRFLPLPTFHSFFGKEGKSGTMESHSKNGMSRKFRTRTASYMGPALSAKKCFRRMWSRPFMRPFAGLRKCAPPQKLRKGPPPARLRLICAAKDPLFLRGGRY